MKGNGPSERKRRAQESTYRLMTARCGNAPGYEEAVRALYRADAEAWEEHIADWPDDVRKHLAMLVAPVFARSA